MRKPSATTMALSTSIPRARMRAPRETFCRSMCIRYMPMKVIRMFNISTKPMRRPLLRPMKSMRSPMTIPTDSTRFITKAFTDSVTMSLW
jgi:hypothetical protein